MALAIIGTILILVYGGWKTCVGSMMLTAGDHNRKLDEYKLEYSDGSSESTGEVVRRESRKDLIKGIVALGIGFMLLIGLLAG